MAEQIVHTESPRQKLHRLTHDYLKDQYAGFVLRYIEEEYEQAGSPGTFDAYVREWYKHNGYHKVIHAITRFFPEVNNRLLTESDDIWRKYTQILEVRRKKNVPIEGAISFLTDDHVSIAEIRRDLLNPGREEPPDASRHQLSAFDYYRSRIVESIKGFFYVITHWK